MLAALRRWIRPAAALDERRWVVVDVETSGLDVRRDRLIVIAAVALRVDEARLAIDLGDSFEAVLRQPDQASPPDKANILLHGVGVGAQRAGLPAVQVLQAFATFAGASPLLAFHAAFDRIMIQRARREASLPPLRNPWLDLAPLAAVLRPDLHARSLDDWLAQLGIRCAQRHEAAADTLATADLLLKLWPALCAHHPQPRFAKTAALVRQRRWLQAGR